MDILLRILARARLEANQSYEAKGKQDVLQLSFYLIINLQPGVPGLFMRCKPLKAINALQHLMMLSYIPIILTPCDFIYKIHSAGCSMSAAIASVI